MEIENNENIYKIHVNHRNYTEWTISSIHNFEKLNIPINPFEKKLFTGDTFYYLELNNNYKFQHVYSNIRNSDHIPCVLVLEGNKTYGRYNTKGKLLYKCIPDDIRIPFFLVPYEIKQIGFSKQLKNLFVTIQYCSWDENNKHPIGKMNQVLGTVDNLASYYEYHLYCKSLNHSIQNFTKQTTNIIKQINSEDKLFDFLIEKREMPEWEIFTIDPEMGLDFDDAFSIKKLDNNEFILSIYISNVPVIIDKLNLWDSFSKRVTTIYLPDKKKPMLPNILSENLCSLLQNTQRVAFTLDIYIKDTNIIKTNYKTCLIKVFKNYKYEERDLLYNKSYNIIFNLVNIILQEYPLLKYVENSHDLVSYLMIFLNFFAAEEMIKYNNGIFRSNVSKNTCFTTELPKEISNFIYIWKKNSSQYVDLSRCDPNVDLKHEMLDLTSYIHITSPIRRLVDLLNMIQFQINNNMYKFTEKAIEFYNYWIKEIDYINTSMISINKIQTNCDLLFRCFTNREMLKNVYEGYCFDKVIKNEFINEYNVFIPELKIIFNFKGKYDISNYEKKKFILFLFENEENYKKKIRLKLLE
jgi:exoribonuclease R